LSGPELIGYLLFCVLAAFITATGFLSATVLLARLGGASLRRQIRFARWGRSVGFLLGLCVLGLLIIAGWPYFVGTGSQ
jgi:hypothetical protein